MATDSSEPSTTIDGANPARLLRVLVVEDQADVAYVVQTLIRHAGYEPRCAASGQEALTMSREFRPDVAFVDIGLPDMNGCELAAQLRAAGDLPVPVLIALTGRDEPEDRRQSEEAGFLLHLVKPPDWRQLAQILQQIADQRRDAP